MRNLARLAGIYPGRADSLWVGGRVTVDYPLQYDTIDLILLEF